MQHRTIPVPPHRYTHYFYCVLRAKYTMPAWRLNDVPIAMYSATHFYFTSYHVLANLRIRFVRTAFARGQRRDALRVRAVLRLRCGEAHRRIRRRR